MSTKVLRALAPLLVPVLLAAACSSDGSNGTGGGRKGSDVDYDAIGLWDDGPCDDAKAPLVVGQMAVFDSPVLSLASQGKALEVAADAFNARGGANGACIEVHLCDDGSDIDRSIACVEEIDQAGVVATINDTGTAANAEVAAAMGDAGIPRVAMNVSPADWAEPLSYPLDSSATGGVFLLPQALADAGSTEIGIVRVSAAAAAALVGLLQGLYEDDGVTFPVDLPVDPGTTDYSQFPLRVQDAGATSMSLALGEAESTQVIRATQQLGSDLLIGTLAFTHDSTAELDDFAEQMVMVAPYPPATVDLPVYRALRADLAASGDEQLQPEALTINTMRSWIGLYALLRVIRDSGMADPTREGIDAALRAATDVPMLGIFGDAGWTPALDHPGAFKRAGIDRVAVYRWDPRSTAAGYEGNFVEAGTISFDDVLCGSPLGAPAPC